jgi:hypothetical protein
VLARINQIQSQLGMSETAVSIVGSLDTGASAFATVLAGQSGAAETAGGMVTSDAQASSWAIPWATGTQPTSSAPTTTVAALASRGLHAPIAAGTGAAVRWPLHGTITQGFGPTSCTLEPPATVNGKHYAHYHDGLDIGAPLGTPVKSMAAGTVEFAGRYPDGAMVVRVRHADGSVALYAHLQPGLDVHTGDKVAEGETLGKVGMTGHTTGPHLHLELTVKGKNIDPLPVLRSGELPGAVKSTASKPASAASGSWTAASPLAASDAKVSRAALDRFDKVASQIPYHAQIRDAAVRAGIDPLFLASLVKAESSFHANAVSYAGAMGLCQLMPATAKSMGVKDPFDPVQNLRAGARYIANNLRIFGRADLALAAYHDGKGAVHNAGGVPDSTVTHNYIDRICSYWSHYREAAA